MGWSNNIPPQIQTLPDGSTQFNGPIVVTDDLGNTEASIGTDGSINGNQVNTNFVNLNGSNLQDLLDDNAKGVITLAQLVGQSFAVTTGVGIVLVLAPLTVDPGRRYRFKWTDCSVFGNTTGNVFQISLGYFFAYPTTSSATFQNVDTLPIYIMNSSFAQSVPSLEWEASFTNVETIWVGLTIQRLVGSGSMFIQSAASGNHGNFLSIEDIGKTKPNNNGVYDPIPYAGGTPPPPPTTRYSQFGKSFWSQTYDSDSGGNPYFGGTDHIWQGDSDAAGGFGHGIFMGAWNFDYNVIQSNLSGATSLNGQLNMYCEHSWSSGGMTLEVYSHNTRSNSAPGNQSGLIGLTWQYHEVHVSNPGWVQIDISSLMPAFQNGTLTGFAVYANTADLNFYGYLAGNSEGNAPTINYQYTK